VNTTINMMNVIDFERQAARNQWLMLEAQGKDADISTFGKTGTFVSSGGTPAEAAAVGMAPMVAESTGQAVDKILATSEPSPGIAAHARTFSEKELEPPDMQRLIMSLEASIASQDTDKDLILMPGDSVYVPQKQETIHIVGAVTYPSLVHYSSAEEGKDFNFYINRVGGFAEDANMEKVMVARVDGSIMNVENIEQIEPGDIIYVPPKVVSLEIKSTSDKVIDAIKFSVVTLAGLAAFIALIGLL